MKTLVILSGIVSLLSIAVLGQIVTPNKDDAGLRICKHFHCRYCDGELDLKELKSAILSRKIEAMIPTSHADSINLAEKHINLIGNPTGKVGIQNFINEVLNLRESNFEAIPGLEMMTDWDSDHPDRASSHMLALDATNPDLQKIIFDNLGTHDLFGKILVWCNSHKVPTVAAHPTHKMPTVPNVKKLIEEGKLVAEDRTVFSYPYDFRLGMPRLFEMFNLGTSSEVELIELLKRHLSEGQQIGVTSGNDFHTRISNFEADPRDADKDPIHQWRYDRGSSSSCWDRVTGIYGKEGERKPATKDQILEALWDGRSDARNRYVMRLPYLNPPPSITPIPCYIPGFSVRFDHLGTDYEEKFQVYTIGKTGVSEMPVKCSEKNDSFSCNFYESGGWKLPEGTKRTYLAYLPKRWIAIFRMVKTTPKNLPKSGLVTEKVVELANNNAGIRFCCTIPIDLRPSYELITVDQVTETILGFRRINRDQMLAMKTDRGYVINQGVNGKRRNLMHDLMTYLIQH